MNNLPTSANESAIRSILMIALYLNGNSQENTLTRNWRNVQNLIETKYETLDSFCKILQHSGLQKEAEVLCSNKRLNWATQIYTENKALTCYCPDYPKNWSHNLKTSAPPALWKKGMAPKEKYIAIVGSRKPSTEEQAFTYQCAFYTVEKGFAVCSGGAIGTDTWAAYGALKAAEQYGTQNPVLEILPYGINHLSKKYPACRLSACAPNTDFSSQQAMFRNNLIYGTAALAIVVSPRLKQGGSWHGAISALQKNLCPVAVKWAPNDPAVKELVRRGAFIIKNPSEIESIMNAANQQKTLF